MKLELCRVRTKPQSTRNAFPHHAAFIDDIKLTASHNGYDEPICIDYKFV